MFHHDPAHTGVAGDPTIGTGTHLSQKWSVKLGGGSYSSPAVAWNTTLNKLVVYVGNQFGAGHSGRMTAVDAATGTVLWAYPAGGDILSSPAVYNGVVYFGNSGHTLFAVDATSGKLVCSYRTTGKLSASPVVADPGDGDGPVVYIGDNGPHGSGAPDQGNLWAINASKCTLKWKFNAFNLNPAGSYNQPGFAFDQKHRPLVVFGSTDNDNSIYALNASTGAEVWRFQTLLKPDGDVGAGPTISAPGVNGFADGVVYDTGKDRQVYALNLTTGAKIWQFDILKDSPGNHGDSQSVAALVGHTIYLGWGAGLYALDAATGAKVWKVDGLPPVLSSPAVTGPAGSQVLLVGDTGGTFRMFDLNGKQLYSLSTGGFIYSSPAVAGGRVYFSNAQNGNLYALG